MLFIKCKTTEGKIVYIATEKIISITPHGSTATVLAGAGIYWHVYIDSMELSNFNDIIKGD